MGKKIYTDEQKREALAAAEQYFRRGWALQSIHRQLVAEYQAEGKEMISWWTFYPLAKARLDELKAEGKISADTDGPDGQDGQDGPDGRAGTEEEAREADDANLDGQDGQDGLDGSAETEAEARETGNANFDGLDGLDGPDGRAETEAEARETGNANLDGLDGLDGPDGRAGTEAEAREADDAADAEELAAEDVLGVDYTARLAMIVRLYRFRTEEDVDAVCDRLIPELTEVQP